MALRNAVLFYARDKLTGDLRLRQAFDLGLWIDAEDESGAIVHTLSFKNALTFIPEVGAVSAASGVLAR
jgi:hypothetical protein